MILSPDDIVSSLRDYSLGTYIDNGWEINNMSLEVIIKYLTDHHANYKGYNYDILKKIVDCLDWTNKVIFLHFLMSYHYNILLFVPSVITRREDVYYWLINVTMTYEQFAPIETKLATLKQLAIYYITLGDPHYMELSMRSIPEIYINESIIAEFRDYAIIIGSVDCLDRLCKLFHEMTNGMVSIINLPVILDAIGRSGYYHLEGIKKVIDRYCDSNTLYINTDCNTLMWFPVEFIVSCYPMLVDKLFRKKYLNHKKDRLEEVHYQATHPIVPNKIKIINAEINAIISRENMLKHRGDVLIITHS